jgi:PAS domain S-box-containing protein
MYRYIAYRAGTEIDLLLNDSLKSFLFFPILMKVLLILFWRSGVKNCMKQWVRGFIYNNLETMTARIMEDMNNSEYFKYSTARKSDGEKTLEIILNFLESDFDCTIKSSYETELTGNKELFELVDVARRHHERGISLSMFLGMLKMMQNVINGLVCESSEPEDFKIDTLHDMGVKFNYVEHIMVSEWDDHIKGSIVNASLESAMQIAITKCRIQNILDSVNEIVVTFDENGFVQQCNTAAKKYFGEITQNSNVLSLLKQKNCAVNDFVEKFKGRDSEIKIGSGEYFNIRVKYLGDDYLTQTEYILLMHNITKIVDYRNSLELEINQQTQELRESKLFFESVFFTAGDALLIYNEDNKLVKANHKACELFGIKSENIDDNVCIKIMAELLESDDNKHICAIAHSLKEKETWTGECKLFLSFEDIYAYISINKFNMRDVGYFCISIKNITELKNMQKALQDEKQTVEEKNIALKNIIETIRRQNETCMVEFAKEMETELLPLLKKIYSSSCVNEKYEYYHKICNKLHFVVDAVENCEETEALREVFSKLSSAEERVGRMILNGHTTKEIAEKLCLSDDTVQTHRRNIRKKLNINNQKVSIYNYLKAIQLMHPGCAYSVEQAGG